MESRRGLGDTCMCVVEGRATGVFQVTVGLAYRHGVCIVRGKRRRDLNRCERVREKQR